jgi:hypothetical protein
MAKSGGGKAHDRALTRTAEKTNKSMVPSDVHSRSTAQAEPSSAPRRLTKSERVLRFIDSPSTQTLAGIVGGLVGTFLDARYFCVLCLMTSLGLKRSKALDGIEPKWVLPIHLAVMSVVGAALFLVGIPVNRARPQIYNPHDIAQAVWDGHWPPSAQKTPPTSNLDQRSYKQTAITSTGNNLKSGNNEVSANNVANRESSDEKLLEDAVKESQALCGLSQEWKNKWESENRNMVYVGAVDSRAIARKSEIFLTPVDVRYSNEYVSEHSRRANDLKLRLLSKVPQYEDEEVLDYLNPPMFTWRDGERFFGLHTMQQYCEDFSKITKLAQQNLASRRQ